MASDERHDDRYAGRLRERTGIDVRSEVVADDQHATVWPSAVTRGLLHLYRVDPGESGEEARGPRPQTPKAAG